MRILLCGINYAPDLIGVAKYNTELCEWLQERGHEVRVITAPPYYPEWRIPEQYKTWLYRHEIRNGVAITRVPIFVPRRPSGISRLLHHASFAVSSIWPVTSEVIRWRPDLIFSVAPSLMSSAFVGFIGRRKRIPTWLHIQDLEIDAAFGLRMLRSTTLRAWLRIIEKAIIQSFSSVSTIAPQLLQRLKAKGISSTKLTEFRNWTDTSSIVPEQRDSSFIKALGLNLNKSDILALYSGTMSYKQGLELIVEAAKVLAHTRPGVQFILCGEGPLKPKLQAAAAGLSNIHFLGLQPEDCFPKLLNAADLHLIPQKAEAADLVLPSKLGAILASGRPVLAMADPSTGLAEEVDGAGLVVKPGSTADLVEAIKSLAENSDLRVRLGAAARERALQRWEKNTILRTLESELQKASTSKHSDATKSPQPAIDIAPP